MRMEIRIAGLGGHGILLMGRLIGVAATVYEGIDAVLTTTYSPEQRGGWSAAHLVVSDEPIAYHVVTRPDIFTVTLNSMYYRWVDSVREGGLVIYESDLVKNIDESKCKNCRFLGVPAFRMVEEAIGNRRPANIFLLGAMSNFIPLIKPESFEEAIKSTIKAKYVDMNLDAFHLGRDYTKQMRQHLTVQGSGGGEP